MTRIVIIGAGIVGAAIAYELSLIPGLDIILLDEQEPSSGSTGGALGVLAGVIHRKGWTLRKASLERYETLIPELESRTGQVIPYNRQGILLLQSTETKEESKKWHKLQRDRHDQGYRLERWNLDQLSQKCPDIDLENVISAIYSPQDRQVHPRILTESLIKVARLNGVECQFGVKVELLTPQVFTKGEKDKIHLHQIQTSQGTISADQVVISAGIGSRQITQSLGQPLDIRPVLGQALHLKLSQPLKNLEFQPIITSQDIHIVPLGFGEYWIGATIEFPSEKGEVSANTSLLETVLQQAIAVLPAFSEAQILRSWSGQRPRPEAELAPVIRELEGYDNVLLATGHYRNGVLLAPATALVIRAKVLSLLV
jgi:glycine oxidase